VKRFLAAFCFLTAIPLPRRLRNWAQSEGAHEASAVFFPLIGAVLGTIAMGVSAALGRLFPRPVTAFLVVLVLLALCGGLHADGLADTADGFLSSRARDGVLEIMKDSRIGAMGAIALVLVLGLKVAALVSLPRAELVSIAAFLMPVCGRCAMTLAMVLLPYARPEGGLGGSFSRSRMAAASATAVLLSAGWLAAGTSGLVAGVAALAASGALAAWSYRKIGGFTGDVLGACCEVAETAAAVALSAVFLPSQGSP